MLDTKVACMLETLLEQTKKLWVESVALGVICEQLSRWMWYLTGLKQKKVSNGDTRFFFFACIFQVANLCLTTWFILWCYVNGTGFILLLQTEMTTAERELDANTNYDWNRIQESGKDAELLFGPGYTGLANLGNR